jgi:hypothetical protein
MAEHDDKSQNLLAKVDPNRRGFVKRVLAGAAFAAPIVATFSIDGLSVDSAMAQVTTSGVCSLDPGYVGPSSYRAHVSGSGTRVNGEVQFSIDYDPRQTGSLDTSLEMTENTVVTEAYISVNSVEVATIPLHGESIDTANITGLCDFDALLQAMAAGQATVTVIGTYEGSPYTVTGPVVPLGGERIIRLP